jgi:2-isopropylmalate synthase
MSLVKYLSYLDRFNVNLVDRTWPNKRIVSSPTWCAVDLRDGNQALINPMNPEQKREFFKLLVDVGFKEIEISFPSASQVDFNFTRQLVNENLIPDYLTPQVLTPARPAFIRRTFEAIEGMKQVIMHMYNPTSEVQRRLVFQKDKNEIIALAVEGTKLIKELSKQVDSKIIYEYSPESFTGTELDFAKDICEAVMNAWEPTEDNKIILNLPATVELATPNVFADQIEWFINNVSNRKSYILSLHTHNDRGTGVAATELGLLAGGDRVEGTLFGNGERTGNVDVVTLALNMLSQGVDPKLDFSRLEKVKEISERLTGISTHCRHPYAGDLVFTAFSGSHQDAISKGLREQIGKQIWEVPYLPIDPADIGRQYDSIVRINSQSGKGGVAYVLRAEYGCDIPKSMHPEFSQVIQQLSENLGTEVSGNQIWRAFSDEYLDRKSPFLLKSFTNSSYSIDGLVEACLNVVIANSEIVVTGTGNGPLSATVNALANNGLPIVSILSYSQHSRSAGSDAEAVAYIQIESDKCEPRYGVGIDVNTHTASIKALFSALNRMYLEWKILK